MFSIRDLIEVWGLPHLNKVGIKYNLGLRKACLLQMHACKRPGCLLCISFVDALAQALFEQSGVFMVGVVSSAMTALQQLDRLPEHFKALLHEACPQVFTMEFHSLDNPMRFCDVFEMYSGSARVSTCCEQAWFFM